MGASEVSQDNFRIIAEEGAAIAHNVRPGDIQLPLYGCFGKAEIEATATNLVRFFQKRTRWSEFTLEELRAFYLDEGLDPNRMLFGLAGAWWDNSGFGQVAIPTGASIVQWEDGTMTVTQNFVNRCARRAKIQVPA